MKPCPLCSATEGQTVESNGIGDFYVLCPCGGRTDDYRCEDRQFAIDRWDEGNIKTDWSNEDEY